MTINLDPQELKLWKYNSQRRVQTAAYKRWHIQGTYAGMTELGFIATSAKQFFADILSAQLYEFALPEQRKDYSRRVAKLHELVTDKTYIPNRSDYGQGYGRTVGKLSQPTTKNPYDYCWCEWAGIASLEDRAEKSDQSYFLDDEERELGTAFVIRLPHNNKRTPSSKITLERLEYDDAVYRNEECISNFMVGLVEHEQTRRHPYNAGTLKDLANSMSGGVCLSREIFTGTLEDAMRYAESRAETYAEERQVSERNYHAGVQAADVINDAVEILEHVAKNPVNPISLADNSHTSTRVPSAAERFGLTKPADPRDALSSLQDDMKLILEQVDSYDADLQEAFNCGLADNVRGFETGTSNTLFTYDLCEKLTGLDLYDA